MKDGAVLVPSCLQSRTGRGTKGQAMGSRGHREVTPCSQRARPQAGVQVSSGPANPGRCSVAALLRMMAQWMGTAQLLLSGQMNSWPCRSSLLRPPVPLRAIGWPKRAMSKALCLPGGELRGCLLQLASWWGWQLGGQAWHLALGSSTASLGVGVGCWGVQWLLGAGSWVWAEQVGSLGGIGHWQGVGSGLEHGGPHWGRGGGRRAAGEAPGEGTSRSMFADPWVVSAGEPGSRDRPSNV